MRVVHRGSPCHHTCSASDCGLMADSYFVSEFSGLRKTHSASYVEKFIPKDLAALGRGKDVIFGLVYRVTHAGSCWSRTQNATR
jgi:hypothetical protein